MSFLSATLSRVKPSPTIAMTAKAAELKAAGPRRHRPERWVSRISTRRRTSRTPPLLPSRRAKTKYTAPDGIPELKQAACAKMKRDHGLDYTPAQISVGTGGKQTLYNALMATMNEGR